jgi:hypothetical protein
MSLFVPGVVAGAVAPWCIIPPSSCFVLALASNAYLPAQRTRVSPCRALYVLTGAGGASTPIVNQKVSKLAADPRDRLTRQEAVLRDQNLACSCLFVVAGSERGLQSVLPVPQALFGEVQYNNIRIHH